MLKTITDICTAIGAIATAFALFYLASQAHDSSRQTEISIFSQQSDNLAKRIDLVAYIQKLETASHKLSQWSDLLKATSDNSLLAFVASTCATSTEKLCGTDGIESALEVVSTSLRDLPPSDSDLSAGGYMFINNASKLLDIHEPGVTVLTSQDLAGDIKDALDVCGYFVPGNGVTPATLDADWEDMQLSQRLAIEFVGLRDNSMRFLAGYKNAVLSDRLQSAGQAAHNLKIGLIALRKIEEAHTHKRPVSDMEALKWGIEYIRQKLSLQVKSCQDSAKIAIDRDSQLRVLIEKDLAKRQRDAKG